MRYDRIVWNTLAVFGDFGYFHGDYAVASNNAYPHRDYLELPINLIYTESLLPAKKQEFLNNIERSLPMQVRWWSRVFADYFWNFTPGNLPAL